MSVGMFNSTQNCRMEIWIWTKTIWNVSSIIADIMLLNLLLHIPNLLSGCFDKLYISTIVADLIANIARVLLRYAPVLLCDHDIFYSIEMHFPLATVINAMEWYLSYVMICSSFFFNIDHAFLVIFPKDYFWICNNFIKCILVAFCWLAPLIWVLPMVNNCCYSIFVSDSMQPIFEQSEIEDIYDTIDMIIETFFYIPIIFVCNFISIIVLHYRYERSQRIEYWQRMKRLRQHNPNDIWQTGINKHKQHNELPHLKELKVDWCSVGDAPQPYLNNLTRQSKKDTILIHRRIVAEFNMSLVTLIDQIFDAVGVLFYLLFWGALHDWISVDSETVLFLYDICWELGTTTQPFLLFLMCPQVRKAFVNYYSLRFTKVSYCLTQTVSFLTRRPR